MDLGYKLENCMLKVNRSEFRSCRAFLKIWDKDDISVVEPRNYVWQGVKLFENIEYTKLQETPVSLKETR